MNTSLPSWLVYCRPGFERDCVEETQAKPIAAEENSGYLVLQGKPRLAYTQLTFARQLLRLHGEVNDLPERDRLTPLLAAITRYAGEVRRLVSGSAGHQRRQDAVRLHAPLSAAAGRRVAQRGRRAWCD